MNALEFSGIRKGYGDFSLVIDRLEIPRGYIFGLIGPNGAGKTTLLKAALGLVRCDSGSIRVFDQDLEGNTRQLKSRIGFVHEQDYLFENLSLGETASIVKKVYSGWDDSSYKRFLKRFGLRGEDKLKTMSKGTRMKCAIVLCFSHHPELVLLDEPMAGLDPLMRNEVLEVIGELIREGERTVVLSTHITSDLDKIADYIGILDHGSVLLEGARDTILDERAICKGGKHLLNNGSKELFQYIRYNEYGFAGLTDDPGKAREVFGDQIILERPKLEDMMLFLLKGEKTPGVNR